MGKNGLVAPRAWFATCFLALGCTALAGLDKDYELVPNEQAGGTSGTAGTAGLGGGGGSSGTGGGGSSGTGGGGGSSGTGGGGTSGTGGGGSSGTGSGGSPSAEDCANAADDDGDQRADCFDQDCRDSAACAGKCADAALLDCGTAITGQSSDAAGSTARIAPPDYACAPGLRPGPEYAYRIGGDVGDTVFVGIYGLAADLGIFMVEVGAGAACDAVQGCRAFGDAFSGSEPEALDFGKTSGRDYFVIVDGPAAAAYSITAHCSTSSTCRPVRSIQAGQTITATNALGATPNVTDNQASYTCASGIHAAPEVAYMFTPTQAGDYEVALTGLGGNLDLFIVAAPDCDTRCLTSTSSSTNASTQSELVVLSAQANTSYYIVVDGYVIVPFTLSVTQR